MSIKIELHLLFAWLTKEFSIVENKLAPAAVSILQHVKQMIANGELDYVAKVADFILKSNLPDEFAAIVKNKINYWLAAALVIQGLPTDPVEAAKVIIAAYNHTGTNKPAVNSKACTDMLQELKAFADSSKQETWAVDAAEVEKCFQILIADTQQSA